MWELSWIYDNNDSDTNTFWLIKLDNINGGVIVGVV